MAANNIPGGLPDLFHLANECVGAATALGAGIPLVLNTSALLGGARDTAFESHADFRNRLAELPAMRGALKLARVEARAFAMKARNWLENSLGPRHTLAWSAVGFDNHSLAIPKDDAGLESLLERMSLYFTGNASEENPDSKVNVTAARAAAFGAALTGATIALNAKRQEVGTTKSGRDDAVRALRKRLHGLVSELGQALSGDDPRWRQFGLNLPSAPNVPAAPQSVTVNTNTPGEFFITCAASAYATYYRFFTRRPNLNEEPVHVGNSVEPMFHLSGLASGQEYEILVTASNAGGESHFSQQVMAIARSADEAAA